MKTNRLRNFLHVVFIGMGMLFSYIKYYNMNINDIGLTALSWVKKLRGESVDIDALKLENQASMTHEIWGDLLKQHVTEAGQVNYEGFLKNKMGL